MTKLQIDKDRGRPKHIFGKLHDKVVTRASQLEGTDEIQFPDDASVEDNGTDGYWVECYHFFTYEEIDEGGGE